MGGYTVDVAGEHLVLAAWTRFRTVDEASAFRAAIARAVMRASPACICADWRKAETVALDVAEVLRSMLVGTNRLVVRSAILLAPDHGAFNLQAERLVREAGSPGRRTFRNVDEQLAYLGSSVTPRELAAARAFLEH